MITVLEGDCLKVLPTLQANSIQTVVTSPPFFNLRNYHTGKWIGGVPDCQHNASPCATCGAEYVDHQIGLEATPEEFVDAMVNVFREVRRVLRPDGVCFVNMGDTYSQGGRGGGTTKQFSNHGTRSLARFDAGIGPKQLLLIPHRLLIALQIDGWTIRNDIILTKAAPMPESVIDRCTRAHEHLFVMTKATRYFWDQDAIREQPTGRTAPITSFGHSPDRRDNGRVFEREGDIGANARDVWPLTNNAFHAEHFATMPVALAERCIKAASRPGDLVLDPFAGAGTTGAAATDLGRRSILIELNPSYCRLIHRRLALGLCDWQLPIYY